MSNPFRDEAPGCRRHGGPLVGACAGCGAAACDECWQWAGATLRCATCARSHQRRTRVARTALAIGTAAVVALFGAAIARNWHDRSLPVARNVSFEARQLTSTLTEHPCDTAVTVALLKMLREENGCLAALPLVAYTESHCAAESPVLEIGTDCHLENADLDLARAEAQLLVLREPLSPLHRVRLARALERIGKPGIASQHYQAAKNLLAEAKSTAPADLLATVERGLAHCRKASMETLGQLQ